MVARLYSLFKRWEKFPNEMRPVFVHNIPDLAFPVARLPLKQYQKKSSDPIRYVPDFEALPAGALIIIDECQGHLQANADGQHELLFPPRSSVSEAPPHVAFLTVHRHHGFDIWLATQNPKLIDFQVRALVGLHRHYRRLFGGNRAVCYEWDACSDNLSGTKTAVKSFFPFPRDAFKFYKSAEVHNKQKFRLPLWLFIPVVGLVMGVAFIPKAYSVIAGGISGKGISASDTVAPEPFPATSAGVPLPPSPPVNPAPINAAPVAFQPAAEYSPPKISSCIANATRCKCYTDKGVPVGMPEVECRASVLQLNERFKLDEQPPVVSASL